MKRFFAVMILLVVSLLFAATCFADYDSGKEAFDKKDYQQAMQLFMEVKDNPAATYHIGLMYQLGLGVKKDFAEAFDWYEKGAELNGMSSKLALVILHATGLGVPSDPGYAYTLLQGFAEEDAQAKIVLAAFYRLGLGTKRNNAAADEIISKMTDDKKQRTELNNQVNLYVRQIKNNMAEWVNAAQRRAWFSRHRKKFELSLATATEAINATRELIKKTHEQLPVAESALKKSEEALKLVAEKRVKIEETLKAETEAASKAEATAKAASEKRAKIEETLKAETEAANKAETAAKAASEKRAAAEKSLKDAEAALKKSEEALKLVAEKRVKIEETLKAETEAANKAEAAAKAASERRAAAGKNLQDAESALKKSEEALKLATEERAKIEETLKAETEAASKAEAAVKAASERRAAAEKVVSGD